MWTRVDAFLRRLPRPLVALAAAAAVVAIGALDTLTPRELSLAAFDLLPVCVAAWYAGTRSGVALALLAALAWFADDELSTPVSAGSLASPWWNLAVKVAFFAVSAVVVSRLRRATDRERALARRDPLTGLANRLAFFELAAHELESARRRGEPVSLAFLDVDDFKGVNDRAGHEAGDRVLAAVAGTLSAELRAADVVARLGGDEFVALLPGADAAEAHRAVDRVRAVLSGLADSTGARVSVSVGVASFAEAPSHADQLIRAADELMYQAKSKGKGVLAEPYGAALVPRESPSQ